MQQIKSCRRQLHRPNKLTLARPSCEAGCSRRWFRQSGILAPWSTVPVGVPGALVSSTAPGGSLADVLSGSTADVEGIIRLNCRGRWFPRRLILLNFGDGCRGNPIRLNGSGYGVRLIRLNCGRR